MGRQGPKRKQHSRTVELNRVGPEDGFPTIFTQVAIEKCIQNLLSSPHRDYKSASDNTRITMDFLCADGGENALPKSHYRGRRKAANLLFDEEKQRPERKVQDPDHLSLVPLSTVRLRMEFSCPPTSTQGQLFI